MRSQIITEFKNKQGVGYKSRLAQKFVDPLPRFRYEVNGEVYESSRVAFTIYFAPRPGLNVGDTVTV